MICRTRGITFGIAVVVMCTFTPAHAQENPEKEVRRLAALIAAKKASLEAISGVADKTQADGNITDNLFDKIYGNPGGYHSAEESKSDARNFIEEKVLGQLNKHLASIWLTNSVSQDDIVAENCIPKLDDKVNGAVKKHAGQVIDGQHKEARKRAVQKQWDAITLDIGMPEQSEIDKELETYVEAQLSEFQESQKWSQYKVTLVKKLVDEGLPDTVVLFEENENEAKSIAEDKFNSIDREYRNQMEVFREWTAEKKVPEDLITRPTIQQFVDEKLKEHVAQKDRTGVPKYGVFSAIYRRAEGKAGILEKTRFETYVSSWELSGASTFLEQTVLQRPTEHRSVKSSRETFLNTASCKIGDRTVPFLKWAQESMIAAYVTLRVKGESRQTVVRYFTTMLGKDNDDNWLGKAARDRLGGQLQALLPEIHAGAAEIQKNNFFGFLDDWRPTVEQIEEMIKQKSEPHDYNAATALFPDNVPGDDLIERTEQLVYQEVRAKVAKGRQSRQSQLGLVDRIATEKRDELEQDVREDVEKNEIIDKWTRRFDEIWKDEYAGLRAAVPNQQQDDYLPWKERCETTNQTIVEKVGIHYDDVKKIIDATPPPPPPPPEDPVTDENGMVGSATNTVTPQDAVKPTDAEDMGQTDTSSGGFVPGTIWGFPGGLGTGGGDGGDGDGKGKGDKKKGEKDGERGQKGGEEEPDIVIRLKNNPDATDSACVATVKDDPAVTIPFDPEAEKVDATIAEGLRGKLEDLLEAKAQAIQSPATDDEKPAIHLRVHMSIQSNEPRYALAPALRAALLAMCDELREADLEGRGGTVKFFLHWSDGL